MDRAVMFHKSLSFTTTECFIVLNTPFVQFPSPLASSDINRGKKLSGLGGL